MNESLRQSSDHDHRRDSSADLDRLVMLMKESLHRGKSIDLSKLTADCPHLREQLEMLQPTLEAIIDLGMNPQDLEEQDSPVFNAQESSGRLGDFQILREVGRGGMGVVYEAEQISLTRRVALKILPMATLIDKTKIERFRNEARAAAMLKHPNIVSVFAIGHDRGIHHYAMELIKGPSLSECLQASTGKKDHGERFQDLNDFFHVDTVRSAAFYRQVARMGIQAAEALHHAHHEGVIHRDIKPGNLLLDARGDIHVSDFGLARIQSESELSMSGDVVGTLRYMSPEQLEVDSRVPLDHRTDVYSLGLTLYEVLTRRPAFDGENVRTLLAQIDATEPPRLRQIDHRIPKDLEKIILMAIAKRASQRYPSARELADDLQRFRDGKAVRARRISSFGRMSRVMVRNPITTFSSVAAILLLVALAIGGQLVARKQRESSRRQGELNYVLTIAAAKQAWDHGDLPRMRSLLDACMPSQRAKDLRGFEWHYLDALAAGDQLEVFDCGSPTHALAHSIDQKLIAVGTHGGTIQLWRAEDSKLIGEQRAGKFVTDMDVSRDGNRLVSVTQNGISVPQNGKAMVWELPSLRPVREIVGHTSGLRSVAFSSDGKRIVTGGVDGQLRIANAQDGHWYREIRAHQGPVHGIAFAPHQDWIASASEDGTVQIWDFMTETLVKRLAANSQLHQTLAFTKDGSTLVTAGWGYAIHVWDTTTWEHRTIWKRDPQRTYALAIGDDNGILLTGQTDNMIEQFDLATGRWLASYRGHTGSVRALDFRDGESTFVSASVDGSVRTWNLQKDTPQSSSNSSAQWRTEVRFSNDGNHVYAASGRTLKPGVESTGAVKCWNARTGASHDIISSKGHWMSVDVSRHGDLVAAGFNYGKTGEKNRGLLSFLKLPSQQTFKQIVDLPPNSCTDVNFHPNGEFVAVAFIRGGLKLYYLETGQWTTIADESFSCISCDFSPDGSILVAGGGEWTQGEIRIWDTTVNNWTPKIISTESLIMSVSAAHQSTTFATAAWGGEVDLWNAETGKKVRSLGGHVNNAACVAFGPNDKTLGSGSLNGNLKLWHTNTGELLLTLKTDTSVQSLDFSPDGSQLAIGGTENQVILLNGRRMVPVGN